MSSLHEHVIASCLPPELGGTFGEVDPQEWYKVLMGDIVQKGMYQIPQNLFPQFYPKLNFFLVFIPELKALGYRFIEEEKK